MDCPHCKVPLIGGMTTCPKCKFDITTIDGGPAHKAWMEGKSITRSELEEAEIQLRSERDSLAKNMLLSSCQTLDGYHIAKYFGLVFGEVAFKSGFLKSLSASMDNLCDVLSFGDKELSGTAKILESSREYAINKLKMAAAALGANAVIGIDSESSVGADIMHITIYGTAVKIEKIKVEEQT